MTNWKHLDFRAERLTALAKTSGLKNFIAKASVELSHRVTLPGPTGEMNTLSMEPRGDFVCARAMDSTADSHISYICAALLAGNFVTLVGKDRNEIAQAMQKNGVPIETFSVSDASLGSLIQTQDMCGVTLNADNMRAREVGRLLADRDGEIAQLIWNEPVTPDLIHRFATEKTITINTAAIGGNAALLGISEHEDSA